MNQKRLHLLLGIGGIYLALLTIYLCLAAGVLLVSTSENAIRIPLATMEKLSKTKRIFALHVELYKYRKRSSREGIS